MMREIENSLFVGGGYVINDKFIVIGESVDNCRLQLPRKALFSIGRHIVKY